MTGSSADKGFIGEPQFRPLAQQSSQGNALSLTSRKLGHRTIEQ
jgi:hypothetical protein